MNLVRVLIAAFIVGIVGAGIGGLSGFCAGSLLTLTVGWLWVGRKKSQAIPPRIFRSVSEAPPSIHLESTPVRSYQQTFRTGYLQWIPAGEAVEIAGYAISSGLVYVCDGEPNPEEASAINKRLPVGDPARGDQAKLGYYSQYGFLSPAQRGAYLEWLGTGRRDENPASRDLGFVFLFFYGIERRLLVDGGQEQEAIAELVRLLHVYGKGRSLQSYSCQLIHFWGWKQGADYYAKLRDWMETLPISLLRADEISIVLASLYQSGKPLSSKLAYEIASRRPDARRSVIVKRVNDEFKALFSKRYAEQFHDGMTLRCAKAETKLEYRPASPSLLRLRYCQAAPFVITIPSVSRIESQFKPLVSIWDSCIEDLAGFSRVKTKQGSAGGLKAHVALPPELRSQTPHPLAAHWEALLGNAHRANSCSLIEAGELAEMIELSNRPKITVSQSREMADAVESLGYGIEPDSRLTGIGYSWDQVLGVFRPKSGAVTVASSNCLGAQFLLELCIFIAGADGHVSNEEIAISHNFLQNQLALAPEDQERLDVIQQVFVSDPSRATASLARIARRVTLDQREKIGQLLVMIAAADNVVTKDELRALERVFKTFELPHEKLDGFLRQIRPDFGEVVVQSGEKRQPGEPIPAPAFQINMSRVAVIMQETNEVIDILSTVMTDEEGDTQIESHAGVRPQINAADKQMEAVASTPTWLSSLDCKYQPVFQKLMERDLWNRPDFDALIKSFCLMPLGARDAINQWSDENLGDFLLEGEDPVQINKQLLPKGEHTNV
jgi:uncharacterized tellurite resistance protein B-like protein